jgi:ABC-2 type transport system ATP-binding protein
MDFRDLCRYTSSFYSRWNMRFAHELARKWEISPARPLATLSGGEQRKAALAIALAPEPDVLILDEPAAGLDPLSRRELINEVIAVLARNTSATILFSTHIISDLERVAQDIGILERGRLMLNRPLDELQACYRRVQVIFPGETAPPRFTIQGAARCRVSGPVVTGVTEYFDLEHIEALKRWPGVRVQVFPLSLEEVFLEVCAPREEAAPQVSVVEPEIDSESKTVSL